MFAKYKINYWTENSILRPLFFYRTIVYLNDKYLQFKNNQLVFDSKEINQNCKFKIKYNKEKFELLTPENENIVKYLDTNISSNSVFELISLSNSKVRFYNTQKGYLSISKDSKATFKQSNYNPSFQEIFEICNDDGTLFRHNLKVPENINYLDSLKYYSKTVNLYKKNLDEILIPAPTNVDESWLGSLLDEKFHKIDKLSKVPKIKKINVDEVLTNYNEMDDELKTNASASYLFAKGDINSKSKNKSLIVSWINKKSETYIDDYDLKQLTRGKLIVTSIIYGWTYNLKLSEHSNDLDYDIGINIPMLKSAGGLQRAIKDNHLTYELIAKGLTLMNSDTTGAIDFSEDIIGKKWIPSAKPVPIYIKCKVYDDFPAVKSMSYKITEGTYTLKGFNIEFTEHKADNSTWDWPCAGNRCKIDPYCKIYLNGKEYKTTEVEMNNTYYKKTNLSIPIVFNKDYKYELKFFHKKSGGDIEAGSFELNQILGFELKKSIPIVVKNGQIINASVYLEKL